MFDQLWRNTIAFANEARYCLQHDFNDFPCRDSWRLIGIICVAVALLIAMLLAFFLLRRKRASQREIARVGLLAQRQNAIEREEVRRSRWTGDENVAANLSEAELEAEIRRAVDARR